MSRLLNGILVLAALSLPLFATQSAFAQRGSSGGGQSGGGGGAPSVTGRQPQQPRFQEPIYIGGRILVDSGRPAAESVTVELSCGTRAMQTIHTDLGGYFTFTLGSGAQSNMDFTASSDAPITPGGQRDGMEGINGTRNSILTGCELRISVPGYYPLAYTLRQEAEMGRIEVGNLQLRRIAGVQGSSISVTSLLVPSNARKEFERAEKDLQGGHSDSARKHLESAISIYQKYAAAWNSLGAIDISSGNADKGREDFRQAIAADPEYIPPYMNLASVELRDQHYEQAVDAATKVLQLDPSITSASFLQAVGNFNLHRLDAAEKGAMEAEKNADGLPQVHALLAEIMLEKQDYKSAAGHMRMYLQKAPTGQYADEMRKDLEQIEASQQNESPVQP